MKSLSKLLIEQIQTYTPLEMLHRVGDKNGNKESNVERTLRNLTVKGLIVPVKNFKNHIVAYEPVRTITYRENPTDDKEEIEVKFIKAQSYFLINNWVIKPEVKKSFDNLMNTLKKNKGEEVTYRTKKNIVKLYENQTSIKA